MNSVESQSSNSGLLGGSPCDPKSSDVFTSPMPKYPSQNRLTATRKVKGFLGSTIHLAKVRRLRGASDGSGGRNDGTPGATFSLGLSYWPRPRTKVSRGF